MRGGDLNQRVIFQRADNSQNGFGELVESWVELATVRSNVTATTGRELYRDGDIEKQPVTVRCRYGSELGNLDAGDRVLVARGFTSTTSAVTATGSTLKIASAAEFPKAVTPDGAGANDYRVRVGSELMTVTSGHGTTEWTVTRGTDASTATTHISGSAVAYMIPLDIESVTPSRESEDLALEVQAVSYG